MLFTKFRVPCKEAIEEEKASVKSSREAMDMEKLKLMRDGMRRFPPGFRFEPTDEELVFEYLKCKIFSHPLPASIIPELNVYAYDPWDLPGELEERYWFSNKDARSGKRKKASRATKSGYWKATGSDRSIVPSTRSMEMVGKKKTLVFYKGKSPNGSRTEWMMHEYRLLNAQNSDSTRLINTQNVMDQMEKWVLCRIFSKKRSEEDNHDIERQIGSASSAASSSSSNGGSSKISSRGWDYAEESSFANSNF